MALWVALRARHSWDATITMGRHLPACILGMHRLVLGLVWGFLGRMAGDLRWVEEAPWGFLCLWPPVVCGCLRLHCGIHLGMWCGSVSYPWMPSSFPSRNVLGCTGSVWILQLLLGVVACPPVWLGPYFWGFWPGLLGSGLATVGVRFILTRVLPSSLGPARRFWAGSYHIPPLWWFSCGLSFPFGHLGRVSGLS